MRALTVNGVAIDDTFAEAFDMRATAIVITAPTARWAAQAAATMTGFATSVIACGCEAGLERVLSPRETPDGRPGVRVLMFAVSTAELQRQLQNRVGQCVLTSPGSACYAGIDAGEDKLKLGAAIRFFGDGWQIAKRLGARRYWRVPVMDGEFVCESTTHLTKSAVGGGNLIVMGASAAKTLAATEAAVKAMREVGDVIMPFPGGIARSGSKVGSKYKGASASTNDAYCPTLKGAVDERSRPRDRLGARNRHRRPHQRGCRRGDARGARRDRRTRPRPRRVARRRRQLRRQARPAPLSPQGSPAVRPLTFASRGAPAQRLDLSPLTPQNLAGKTVAEIARIELGTTRVRVTAGDVFRIREGDPAAILIEGGSARFDRVGMGMTAGAIHVEGEVGVEAGRLMSGGQLTIRGAAGPFAASGMKGGTLEIEGDAGERLGGPLSGETVGMSGGLVLVRGDAGPRAGDRLRRGVILIEGRAGAYAGSRMIAGTLAIGGEAGDLPGYLMGRGTILLGRGATLLSPTFGDCGEHDLVAARLLADYVARASAKLAGLFRRPLRRLAGDLAALGKGEILLPRP